jgi:hypothetical protein
MSILFSPGCTASANECPDYAKFFASIDPEHNSWKEFHNLFIKYKECDDGVYGEGYTDFITRSLARHWDRFNELVKLTASDKVFEDFVLRHIDATADQNDIKLLLANAQQKCPASASSLCSKIIGAGSSALKE